MRKKKILCGNERCRRGPGKTRKRFLPLKPHSKYCSRPCGDAERMRRYYERKKSK